MAHAQVTIQFAPRDPVSAERLADVVESMVEFLEKEAPELAQGPVGSVNLEEKVVELDLTIEANSPAELHEKLSEVLRLFDPEIELDPESPLSGLSYRESTARLEPVPA